MVLWQGLTEGGTAVPVQVTEAGRVVAEGQQGPPGEEGPQGPKGDQGPQGEYGPGDDVDLGKINALGRIASNKDILAGGPFYEGLAFYGACKTTDEENPCIRAYNSAAGGLVWGAYNSTGSTLTSKIFENGSITAAGEIQAGGDAVNGNQQGVVIGNYGGISVARNDGSSTVFAGYGDDVRTPTVSIFGNGSITAADNKAGITSDGELYFTSRSTRYKLVVAGGLVNAEPYTREMELRERAEALRKPRPTDSVPED